MDNHHQPDPASQRELAGNLPSHLVVVDTGSPIASLALRVGEEVVALRHGNARQHSESLLVWLDECLEEAATEVASLGGIVVLRGPGSFTGLRIGLATAMGLSQALTIPGCGMPTLEALARCVPPTATASRERPVCSVVDALRGEWFCQAFSRLHHGWVALEPAACRSAGEIAALGPSRVVGFSTEALQSAVHWPTDCAFQEPAPLAAVVALQLDGFELTWDPAHLAEPLYFRQPAAIPLVEQRKRRSR